MTRMAFSLIIAAALIGQTGYDAAVAAAKADYNAHAIGGNYAVRYLDLNGVAPQHRRGAEVALQFWMPHLSRSSVIEHSEPVHIGHGIYRIDTDRAGWGVKGWQSLAAEYPYRFDHDPLIIRGDWLLRVTSETITSDLYYELLYAGVGVPRNKADFLKVWGVDEKQSAAFTSGVVLNEGQSGVAYKTRLIAHAPSDGGYFWQSFDSSTGFGAGDPLERLAGGLKFEAQELIAAVPKFSLRTGERGLVQAYFLTNAKGVRQDEAPTNIVQDRRQFLGQPSIRTPGSCVVCHAPLNYTSHNAVRERIAKGVELSGVDKTKEFVERFYLSKHVRLIERASQDFHQFCTDAAGCVPAEAITHWSGTVHRYDAPLGLSQAALEFGVTADELKNAMALYSHKIGPAFDKARFSDLATDIPISRLQFEGSRAKKEYGVHYYCRLAMDDWRGAKR